MDSGDNLALLHGPSPRICGQSSYIVGCTNEVFGLKILDVFFCSRQYKEKVQRVTGKPATYIEVESDHWNILNSTALRDTLQDELPKLIASK